MSLDWVNHEMPYGAFKLLLPDPKIDLEDSLKTSGVR